jgi:uncharacterized protein YndB with AHSA1/START domain
MKRDISLERFYPGVPPERVFRALTDPVALAEWLMPCDFQPRLGHHFQFRSKPQGSWNGITDCEVIELEPPRLLAYTWSGQHRNGVDRSVRHTVVRWRLSAEGGGTRLRLEHTGFEGWSEVAVSFLLGVGWKKKLGRTLPELFVGQDAA